MTTAPAFTEHRLSRGDGSLYARDYVGSGPALVLMHGFPDNLGIYDFLVPLLVAGGRRVVTFDFLGFGASDKPAGATYSFAQQLEDLEAVADGLGLETIVPVAHDSSGMAGLNYALAHPGRVDEVVMLNSAYAEDADVLWPEMITLFATGSLHAMALATAMDPAQFGWLLTWQQGKFREPLTPAQRSRFDSFLGPLIRDNFIAQPSAGPAFLQLAAQFFEEHARNRARSAELKALDVPVRLIWGRNDPYITVSVAEQRQAQLKAATLTLIDAGHWLQVDEPEQVAAAILA